MTPGNTVANPYVGPRPFTVQEKDRFFGRDAESNYLIPLVIAERLVLFYAQSGAGKSSLINARLIPGLEERNFVVLTGRVSGQDVENLRPENVFMYNLLASLEESSAEPGQQSQKPPTEQLAKMTLAQYLADLEIEQPGTDVETVSAPAGGDGSAHLRMLVDAPQVISGVRPLALIVDQFEEIFTSNVGYWKHREPFFRQIREAMEEDPYLWVVLTLREDYVAALDPYADLLPGHLRARFYMQRMGYRAALDAVKKPVEQVRKFEADAAEELVSNLSLINIGKDRENQPVYEAGQFVEPVQLQVVCYQLWERLKNEDRPSITAQDLRSLAQGRDLAQFVSEALGNFYEQAVQNVVKQHPEISERRLRDWFSRELITEAETRGAVRQGPETTGSLPNEVVKSLQDRFIIRAEVRGGNTWYELSHDRFVAPILQANRAWAQQNPRPIQSALQAWLDANRDPSLLLEGKQLESVLSLLRDHPDELTEEEEEFLRASQAAADERQRKRQRIVMGIFAGAVVILIGLLIFAGLGWTRADEQRTTAVAAQQMEAQQRKTAERAQGIEADLRSQADVARQTAEVARSTAEFASTLAIDQKNIADAASTQAIDQKNIADAASTQAIEQKATAEVASTLAFEQKAIAERLNRQSQASRLASLSDYFREGNLDLSLLLAIQAVNVSDYWEPRRALLLGVQRGLRNQVERDGVSIFTDQTPNAVAYSPDGNLLAAGLSSGDVRLWAIGSQNKANRIPADFINTIPVTAIAFDPSGKYLVTANVAGKVRIWDMTGTTWWEINPFLPEPYYNTITSLAFQPGGSLLAIAAETDTTGAGKVFIYDIQTGQADKQNEKEIRLSCGSYSCSALAWSPNGARLAIGNTNGDIKIVDVVNNREARDYRMIDKAHQASVKGLAWYPDGLRLISGGLDRRVVAWNVDTRDRILETDQQDTPIVTSFSLSPNGRFLLLGGQDPGDLLVTLWDAETLTRVPFEILKNTHIAAITAAAFSPSGDRFAVSSRDLYVSLWKFVPVNPLGKTVYQTAGAGVAEAVAVNDSNNLLVAQKSGGDQLNVWTQDAKTPVSFSAPHNSLAIGRINGQPAVILGTTGGDVSFLDLTTGQALRDPLKLAPATLRSIALSQDGKWLAASACMTNTSTCDQVYLLDLSDAAAKPDQINMSSHQPGVITSLSFNDSGSRLAIGSSEGQIFLYDMASGQINEAVTGGISVRNLKLSITSVAFGPNDTGLLAAGFLDGRIALWETSTFDPVGEFDERMNGEVAGLTFRQADASAPWDLISVSKQGEVRQWEVSVDSWVQRACLIARRNLTPEEKSRYLYPGIEEYNPCSVGK